MASARCAYCGATLTPNSAYCLDCGQQIPQSPVAASAPAAAAAPVPAARERTGPPVVASGGEVPLPRSLPWQSAHAASPAPVAPAPAERLRETVELVFSTGERVRLTGQAVLGRQPADTAHALGARPIAVDDTTRSVSRVHLFLEVAGGRVSVSDAGSANGSRLQRGASVYQLEPGGAAVAAEVGDVVWLGDVSCAIHA